MRLIDADALITKILKQYCENCEKRKGLKKGKRVVLYDIGDVPCRSCDLDDLAGDIEEMPTVDAVKVVRCENCFYGKPYNEVWYQPKRNSMWCTRDGTEHEYGWFCAGGERREVSE